LLRILSALSWRSVDFCRMLRSDSLSPSPRSDGAFLSVVPDFFSDIIHFPGFVIYYKLAVVIRFLFTASPCSCQYPHSPKISGTCIFRCPFLYRSIGQKACDRRLKAGALRGDRPAPGFQRRRVGTGPEIMSRSCMNISNRTLIEKFLAHPG
jgi:hypothetical protein